MNPMVGMDVELCFLFPRKKTEFQKAVINFL